MERRALGRELGLSMRMGVALAGAPGMGFPVSALSLLVGPWVLGIVGVFALFLLGSAGVFS